MKLVYILFLCMYFQVQAQDWVQVTSLPNAFNETHHSFAFSFDDMGYIVAGNSDSGMRDDFYQYDPVNDSWTELTPFPGAARGFAIGDTWDGKAYFGFGYDGTSLLNDLWVFDSSNMSWTELASCPCAARTHPAMIAHNGKVFVGLGGGGGSLGNLKDWWEYDIASNTWSQKDDLPSLRRHHPYQFGIGDYVYTGFGHGDGIFNDWFRYDIAGETWTQVATLPAEGRVAGTQFSYDGLGYVLSGDGDDHGSMNTGEFWAYDPVTDTWDELPSHPEGSRWAPASFIINGEVYIINGTSFSQYVTQIYKFDLNPVLSTHELTNSSIRIYPNPAIDIINIDLPKNLNYQANLHDLNGRLISSMTNKSVIEIQTLPLGTYLIEIKDLDSGQKVIEKIIKGN
jgi:N-acetylneuraminic acid mutarotase